MTPLWKRSVIGDLGLALSSTFIPQSPLPTEDGHELTSRCSRPMGYLGGNVQLRLGQTEIEIVELPAQACKTKPEFYSLSLDDKTARPGEERIFYF